MLRSRYRLQSLSDRLQSCGRHYGTLTKKEYIETREPFDGIVLDQDIADLKACVDRGVFANPLLRPPTGYKVLSFVIAVKNKYWQQQQDNDLVLESCFLSMWQRAIERHNGDFEAAKADIKAKWKKSPLQPNFKQMINRAYLTACKKWEQK
jgi:hypothetical protein